MSLKVSTVGIIGGGQLGMFLAHSCSKLGLKVFVYSDSKKVPAEKYADKMFYGHRTSCQHIFLRELSYCLSKRIL